MRLRQAARDAAAAPPSTLNPKVEGSNPSRPIEESPGSGAFSLDAAAVGIDRWSMAHTIFGFGSAACACEDHSDASRLQLDDRGLV
jgi:hypothetical protein